MALFVECYISSGLPGAGCRVALASSVEVSTISLLAYVHINYMPRSGDTSILSQIFNASQAEPQSLDVTYLASAHPHARHRKGKARRMSNELSIDGLKSYPFL